MKLSNFMANALLSGLGMVLHDAQAVELKVLSGNGSRPAVIALTQFLLPLFINVQNVGFIGGTSLLIMVSVALETMRQIEANLLTKQYEG